MRNNWGWLTITTLTLAVSDRGSSRRAQVHEEGFVRAKDSTDSLPDLLRKHEDLPVFRLRPFLGAQPIGGDLRQDQDGEHDPLPEGRLIV